MADVVVIGAGISGAAAAFQLAKDGLDVILLGRFGPAAMASGWTLAGVRPFGRHPAELPGGPPAARPPPGRPRAGLPPPGAGGGVGGPLEAARGGDTHSRRSGNLRVARTEQEADIIRGVVREQAAAGLDITLLPDNMAVR